MFKRKPAFALIYRNGIVAVFKHREEAERMLHNVDSFNMSRPVARLTPGMYGIEPCTLPWYGQYALADNMRTLATIIEDFNWMDGTGRSHLGSVHRAEITP